MPRLAPLLTALILNGVGAGYDWRSDVTTDDLVVLTQWNSDAQFDGCNSASVYALGVKEALLHAPRPPLPSVPHGLAATTDFSLVLALSAETERVTPTNHLIRMVRADGDPSRWSTGLPITGAPFFGDQGIAIMPDDETLLLEVAHPLTGNLNGVGKYCLSEMSPDGRIGPQRGFFYPAGPDVSEIFPAANGRQAYVIGHADGGNQVFTIDVATMATTQAPIPLEPEGSAGGLVDVQAAYLGTISPLDRYIVTRRYYESALSVVDLQERKAWTLPVGSLCSVEPSGGQPTINNCGGLAFNHASTNFSLLAVRGVSEVAVYPFVPQGPLRKLGRWPLDRMPAGNAGRTYRHSPVAWSGDGSRLIVGSTTEQNADFLILRVGDGGRSLTPERMLTTCSVLTPQNSAVDIVTMNRHLTHVTDAPPCVPPTPAATAIDIATATFTVTPMPPTRTSSPVSPAPPSTSTPLAPTQVVYFPAIIHLQVPPD